MSKKIKSFKLKYFGMKSLIIMVVKIKGTIRVKAGTMISFLVLPNIEAKNDTVVASITKAIAKAYPSSSKMVAAPINIRAIPR